MTTFNDFGLSNALLGAITKRMGYTVPTKIQEDSIPWIMKGKDVIGESATGSGKTLAFGCGIVEKAEPGKGIQALVMTPTRELAEQVKDSLIIMSSMKQLRVAAIYGGVSIVPQIDALKTADVVVGTPGRILDHVSRRTINFMHIKVLVLDEADRMLDMGFIDDVEKIISLCPKKRQTLFFSATISSDIKGLADRYLDHPKEVSAVKYVDPSKLKQMYYDVDRNMKLSLLVHLLKSEKSGLIMVFCNTRHTTDFVVETLSANGLDAIPIHGGLSQEKRLKTMDMFKKTKVQILVCTDVAARGLHIENVSHIYNYEIPAQPKDYVHRIGRTARAGEEGKVVNLLAHEDYDNFSRILREHYTFNIEKMEKPFAPKIKIPEKKRDNFRRGGFSRGPPRGGSRGPPRRGGRSDQRRSR
ncbi:MAG: DEAD/DEAH box helicase [Candidatus Aenigmarchaeota archaeon]|nr:DEAD/DEAH box helicase [Candidatus Aenigmarchaeota archaeon]